MNHGDGLVLNFSPPTIVSFLSSLLSFVNDRTSCSFRSFTLRVSSFSLFLNSATDEATKREMKEAASNREVVS